MQNAIIQKPDIGRVACNVLVAEGNNPKVLRPLGQLLKSLEAARQQNGFHDALANRYLDGEIDLLFESGLKEKVQVCGVRIILGAGRPAHVTFTSTGLSPSRISLDVPPETAATWIDIRAGGGCIWCTTDDASACEICKSNAAAQST